MTGRTEGTPAAGSPEHWLLHARGDLRAGVVLRGDEWVLGEQACFHFQQAAEKALKGHAGYALLTRTGARWDVAWGDVAVSRRPR